MKKEYQQSFETYHFSENNVETTIVGLKKFISTNNEDFIVLDTNIFVSNTNLITTIQPDILRSIQHFYHNLDDIQNNMNSELISMHTAKLSIQKEIHFAETVILPALKEDKTFYEKKMN